MVIRKFKNGKLKMQVEKSDFFYHSADGKKLDDTIYFNEVEGQADALYAIQTREDGGVLFFLEADDGANQFDKVEKYDQYRAGRQWINEPWADPSVKVKRPSQRW